jgi:hypothetical protein
MRLDGKIKGALAPLFAQHHIFAVVLARGHRRVGQVGQLEKLFIQLCLGGGQRSRQRLDLPLQRGAGRLGLFAFLAGGGPPDLLRQSILLRLQRLRFVLQIAEPGVQSQDRVQVHGGTQSVEPRPNFFGLFAQ